MMKQMNQVLVSEELQREKANLLLNKLLTKDFTPSGRGAYMIAMNDVTCILQEPFESDEDFLAYLEGILDTFRILQKVLMSDSEEADKDKYIPQLNSIQSHLKEIREVLAH